MIKEIQKVVAVGESTDLEVGDWVVLDLTRFIKHVKTKSAIKAGMGGAEMIKEEVVIPFFAVPGDDTPYLKISDREIEGTIPDYEKLPAEVKAYTTMAKFQEEQDKLEVEGKAKLAEAKLKFTESNKNNPEVKTYPLIRTDSQKL